MPFSAWCLPTRRLLPRGVHHKPVSGQAAYAHLVERARHADEACLAGFGHLLAA
jgi:hypothetical protein